MGCRVATSRGSTRVPCCSVTCTGQRPAISISLWGFSSYTDVYDSAGDKLGSIAAPGIHNLRNRSRARG
jgi:hypothetical protein